MKVLPLFMVLIAVTLCVLPASQAGELGGFNDRIQMDSEVLNFVTGTVQDVQGDWFLIQDSQGKEWKIQVDGYTETIGHVLPGVTIMAQVEPNGHAKEVRVITN